MAALADLCRFIPTAAGTTDFVYSSVVGGCQSPAAAGVQNGVKYKLYAVSSDLTQWEIFEGAYNAGTATFPRSTVLYNSSGTGTSAGQSGAGSRINFSSVPQVSIVGLAEDLISVEVANLFTTTQQAQARSNIAAAATPGSWTRTVFAGGSGTYIRKAGCTAINVRMVGGGGGGGGANSLGTPGGAGGNTTFGTSFLAAFGGGGGAVGGSTALAAGGSSSGGDFGLAGGNGQTGQNGSGSNLYGGNGGNSVFGGAGTGAPPFAATGSAAAPNSGSGGGGGSSSNAVAAGAGGGGAGGYLERLIVNPAASYSYAVGSAGSAGVPNSGGGGGGGGSGLIIIDEYY